MISATVVKVDSTPVSSVGTSPIVVGCESHDNSLGWKRRKVGAAHLDPWRLAYPREVSFSKELSALPPRRVEKGLGGGGVTKTYHEHRVPQGKGRRTSDRSYRIFTVSQDNVAAENGSVPTMHVTSQKYREEWHGSW